MKKQNRKERKAAFIKAYQEEMRKQGLMDNPKYGEKDIIVGEETIIEVPKTPEETTEVVEEVKESVEEKTKSKGRKKKEVEEE